MNLWIIINCIIVEDNFFCCLLSSPFSGWLMTLTGKFRSPIGLLTQSTNRRYLKSPRLEFSSHSLESCTKKDQCKRALICTYCPDLYLRYRQSLSKSYPDCLNDLSIHSFINIGRIWIGIRLFMNWLKHVNKYKVIHE